MQGAFGTHFFNMLKETYTNSHSLIKGEEMHMLALITPRSAAHIVIDKTKKRFNFKLVRAGGQKEQDSDESLIKEDKTSAFLSTQTPFKKMMHRMIDHFPEDYEFVTSFVNRVLNWLWTRMTTEVYKDH